MAGEVPGRLGAARTFALTIVAALVVAGCINPAFRESTQKFGTLAKETAEAQTQQVNAAIAAEEERIRTELAEDRADIRLSGGCTTSRSRDVENPQPCVLQRLRGSTLEPIPTTPRYDNILALSASLSNYAGSLATLAADFSEDENAFSEAVTGVATSLGGVDRAIRNVAGQEARNVSEELGAVAALVARIGNLFFAYERNRVLKQIIIEADPLIQRAVVRLTQTDVMLRSGMRNARLRQLQAAEDASIDMIGNRASTRAEVRAAHNRLYEALAAYNGVDLDIRRFQAIAVAHAALRRAAERGASVAELTAAIEAIVDLAGLAHTTYTTLQQGNGSSGDGD